MLALSIIVMILCLAGEGLFLLIAGLPFPGLPYSLYIIGIVWLATCTSTVRYAKRPLYVLMGGWIMLLLTTTLLNRNAALSHTPSAFLYQHSLELLFIAASHLGYFTVLRRRLRARSRSRVG